jgi:hypothetical protein
LWSLKIMWRDGSRFIFASRKWEGLAWLFCEGYR